MRRSYSNWARRAALLLAGAVALVFGLACNDDDDEASIDEIRAIEDVVWQASGSDGSNADWFFAHVTDNLIERVLFSSRDECQANAVECIGEPLPVSALSGTRIDGDTATSTLITDFATLEAVLLRDGDDWQVDSLRAASDEVPDGAASVDLELRDFAFVFEPDDIPADGNVAFHVTNTGSQMHEVVVVQIPEGAGLEEALAAVEAEEAAPVAAKLYVEPGQELDMAFEGPLAPGSYGLVCFFPDVEDPEFTAHLEKGMFAEFTVE